MKAGPVHLIAWIAAALSISASGLADDDARAPETSTPAVERCVEAHEHARLSRLREQWLEARAAMTRCAESSCPLAIRSDCSAWLEEVERLLPTLLIVIERDDAGSDKDPVRLTFDDRAMDLAAELRLIQVLPGTHRLRFSLAGYPPVEREITVAPGEKNRVVRVRFAREARPSSSAPPSPAVPAAPRKEEPSRPIPVTTYVLAGGAAAAFAVSGVLLGSALSSLSSARDTCSPVCEEDERESIEGRLLAADVVGGAGLVLAGVAVYTFITRPTVSAERPVARTALELAPGRASLSLEGRF